MENIGFTIVIGILGSVVGAGVVSLGQFGWRATRESLQTAQQRRVREMTGYHSADPLKKSQITYEYLFSTLMYLFIANLAWILPETVDAALNTSILSGLRIIDREETWVGFWVFSLLSKLFGLIAFYFGLGRILRYIRILSAEPSTNEPRFEA